MTRKRARARSAEISVEITSDDFIRPPREAQRNWLLNRFVRESMSDLEALDAIAARFVPGGEPHAYEDMRTAALADEQIMEEWQLPLMRTMAQIASEAGGDVLEVGYGRGVSAAMLQEHGVRSHTIIECNEHIVRRAERWAETLPDRDIRIVPGLWQDVIADLGTFDAVFFHTYALDEDEAFEFVARSVTFAEHFFPVAAEHLREGGVFTYLTNEIDSLSRAHQRALFQHFSSFALRVVPLSMPEGVRDAWWADSMAVIRVLK